MESRIKKLTDISIDSLRFLGPDTDLTIGLSPKSKWTGGALNSTDGRPFIPNIPTEDLIYRSLDHTRLKIMELEKEVSDSVELPKMIIKELIQQFSRTFPELEPHLRRSALERRFL